MCVCVCECVCVGGGGGGGIEIEEGMRMFTNLSEQIKVKLINLVIL